MMVSYSLNDEFFIRCLYYVFIIYGYAIENNPSFSSNIIIHTNCGVTNGNMHLDLLFIILSENLHYFTFRKCLALHYATK